MRARVVVTGVGLVSSIGNDPGRVTDALRSGKSGIATAAEYVEMGLAASVAGLPDVTGEPPIERRWRRYMGDVSLYAFHAMRRAVDDAGLTSTQLAHPRTALIVGSGVGSLHENHAALETMRMRGASRIAPYAVPRVMGNTVAACLSGAFGIQGASYGITSACASGAHCIGHGADLIRLGRHDTVIVGGAEEARWTSAVLFDAMGALSMSGDSRASRPFDRTRDGFVMGGGAGILVLESLEAARSRGAPIYGEVAGYGATTDGVDMVTPDPGGIARAMQLALEEAGGTVDYVNAHATSTPVGDAAELRALQAVFGPDRLPWISSTKGQTGHAIAAAGALEAIFCLLMMKHGFVAGTAHLHHPDDDAIDFPLLKTSRDIALSSVLTNSMGFGGTNASLILRRV